MRRVNGKELSDLQMIDHYGNLANSYGGRLTAKYKNAVENGFAKFFKEILNSEFTS